MILNVVRGLLGNCGQESFGLTAHSLPSPKCRGVVTSPLVLVVSWALLAFEAFVKPNKSLAMTKAKAGVGIWDMTHHEHAYCSRGIGRW